LRYPGRVFDYEVARLGLQATGVRVKGYEAGKRVISFASRAADWCV
jgi:hypothetical protein